MGPANGMKETRKNHPERPRSWQRRAETAICIHTRGASSASRMKATPPLASLGLPATPMAKLRTANNGVRRKKHSQKAKRDERPLNENKDFNQAAACFAAHGALRCSGSFLATAIGSPGKRRVTAFEGRICAPPMLAWHGFCPSQQDSQARWQKARVPRPFRPKKMAANGWPDRRSWPFYRLAQMGSGSMALIRVRSAVVRPASSKPTVVS